MKIIKKQTIHSSPFLNFVKTDFIDKENKKQAWYSAERTNGGKTVVVAAILRGKLVVTKEFRMPIGDYEWALPAGLVDAGESPEQTAQRELKEETNLELDKIAEFTPYLYNSAGMTNETASIVFCYAKGSTSNEGTEAAEDIETVLMDKSELTDLMADATKKISAKAYLVFDRFVRNGNWE